MVAWMGGETGVCVCVFVRGYVRGHHEGLFWRAYERGKRACYTTFTLALFAACAPVLSHHRAHFQTL